MELNKNHEVGPNIECPICLEDFYTLFELDGCKHKFCYKCINSLRNKCALCRGLFHRFTFDSNTIANALKICDPMTIQGLLELNKYQQRAAFSNFMSHYNVATCWTKREHSQMIIRFGHNTEVREWLLLARREGSESTHLVPVAGHVKRDCSGFHVFDFLIPESVKKERKCQVHLTKTLLHDDSNGVTMNAIQYAVNLIRTDDVERMLHLFPQTLLMAAIISLETCQDKKNYHLAFDNVLNNYSYHDLCLIAKFGNYELDRDVNTAYSIVKNNPKFGVSKKQLLERNNFTNDIELVIRLLLEKKQCRMNENGQIFY